ncbi:hypothetical protein D3C76_1781150 [compost metagenome]
MLIDFHHTLIGQDQLGPFMTGVDAPRLATAQDQTLAVHNVHVARKDSHRSVDNVLCEPMVQFKHGFCPWKCSGLGDDCTP